jgi:hypothetical protein
MMLHLTLFSNLNLGHHFKPFLDKIDQNIILF